MRDRTTIEIDLFLIRHGETPANREHRYLGKTDESLSGNGIIQMQERLEKQTDHTVDMLFVSPMKRCKESAAILYENKLQIEIAEWTEMDFGQYEGKNYHDLKCDPYYQQWIDSNGTLPFPDGESQAEFIARCQNGWKKALDIIWDEAKKDSLEAAAVIHGGTIMALMSLFTGGSYFDYQTKNGCGYHVRLRLTKNESDTKEYVSTIREMEVID